jgi:hypothetical protein
VSAPIGDLLRVAGSRWEITRTLGMWCAEKRDDDGRHAHFLVADSATALAGKITDADEREAAGQE